MKTLEQLKADAYDAAVQVGQWQAKLNELNAAINNYPPAPAIGEVKEQTKNTNRGK